MRVCKLIVLLKLLAMMGLPASSVLASPDPDRLRAAMIFNLTKFVTWPEASYADAGRFRVCVIGEDRVYEHLSAVRGRKVNGLPIVVELVTAHEQACHVVVHAVAPAGVAQTDGTLTIGLAGEFLQGGGMIAIDVEKNRLVFDVNLDVIRNQQLEVSAEVLRLARTVR